MRNLSPRRSSTGPIARRPANSESNSDEQGVGRVIPCQRRRVQFWFSIPKGRPRGDRVDGYSSWGAQGRFSLAKWSLYSLNGAQDITEPTGSLSPIVARLFRTLSALPHTIASSCLCLSAHTCFPMPLPLAPQLLVPAVPLAHWRPVSSPRRSLLSMSTTNLVSMDTEGQEDEAWRVAPPPSASCSRLTPTSTGAS